MESKTGKFLLYAAGRLPALTAGRPIIVQRKKSE
jgi:hypothetical protein